MTAMSGKTIEVINTDAEGRLILADALTYARRQGCTHLVDAATLTGAIVVALGHLNVGLFANHDGLRDRVLAAAREEGERMWAMPLEDEYKDYLKSAFADLANVGARLKKARALPALKTWLQAGGLFQVWGWTKRGNRWRVKRVAVRAEDLEGIVVQAPARRRAKSLKNRA